MPTTQVIQAMKGMTKWLGECIGISVLNTEGTEDSSNDRCSNPEQQQHQEERA